MTKFFFALLLSGILLASCSKNSSPTSTILSKSDSTAFPSDLFFEKNGAPSLNGWIYHPALAIDTANFEMDVPPTGGIWSLKLHKADTPHGTNNVTMSFTNLTSGIYELSSWMKIKYLLPPGTSPEGSISIIKESGGYHFQTTTTSGDSIQWHLVNLVDTLSLLSSDSVTIMLAAGASDTAAHGNPMWFDDVTFKKIK
jgi:hypothetical protein